MVKLNILASKTKISQAVQKFTPMISQHQRLVTAEIMFSPLAEGGPVCIFRSPKFLLKFV